MTDHDVPPPDDEDEIDINAVVLAFIDEQRRESAWKRRVLRFATWLMFINLVVAVGLAVQVQTRNSLIKRVDSQQAALNDSINDLQEFVDDVQEVTPEEQAQTDAVNRVVTVQVPLIIEILCAQTPALEQCQQAQALQGP